jgi:hypothetical protein
MGDLLPRRKTPEEEVMANQDKPSVNENEVDRSDDRYMRIAVGVIMIGLLGGMGINMLVHHESNAETIETTGASQ